MGPGPVIQYRPLKPTALDACSDSVPIVTAIAELPIAADQPPPALHVLHMQLPPRVQRH
jgi:hypothetical protein